MVDGETTDDTLLEARDAGADSYSNQFSGKGNLVTVGLSYTAMDRVVFCDADYTGLSSDHIDWLVDTELGDYEVRIGIPTPSGPIPDSFNMGPFYHFYPSMCGLRALNVIELRESNKGLYGYLMETQLNQWAAGRGWPVQYKYFNDLITPLRFTPKRMAEMQRDRELGWKLGIIGMLRQQR